MASGILAAVHARLTSALTRVLPPLVPFEVDGEMLGWMSAERAAGLAPFAGFEVDDHRVAFAGALRGVEARSDAIAAAAQALSEQGQLSAWRNERYAVRNAFDDAPRFYLERAAARYFGVRTYAVHASGYVERDARAALWFARRSLVKPIDPGLHDTLVGGGIPERDGVLDTLVRESWEEAGLPEGLARRAQAAGSLDVVRAGADGVQRETIFAYDLALPASFDPANQDGEAIEHRLLDFDDAARLVGTPDTTLDCALITLDWLLRQPGFDIDDGARATLLAFCRQRREVPPPTPPLGATPAG